MHGCNYSNSNRMERHKEQKVYSSNQQIWFDVWWIFLFVSTLFSIKMNEEKKSDSICLCSFDCALVALETFIVATCTWIFTTVPIVFVSRFSVENDLWYWAWNWTIQKCIMRNYMLKPVEAQRHAIRKRCVMRSF